MSVEDSRTAEALPDSYAFVVNVSRLVGATSFSLASGHELRRANAGEITNIRETIQRMRHSPITTSPWDNRRRDDGNIELLPESEWRYFVISFQGTNDTLVELEEVFSLLPFEPKIGFTVVHVQGVPGLLWHPGRWFNLLEDAWWWRLQFLDVTESDIEAITATHARLQQHDHRLVDVKRLARQLQDLDALPPHSPLRFLGYFAILESLLTHPPKQTDPYDSITQTTWFKIKNRAYSQSQGREKLFDRERHKEPVPGWHSCDLACEAGEP